MSEGFSADVERIAARANDFDDHAARAERVSGTLRSVLESTGRAWGTDAVGETFQAAHGDSAAQALELLSGLGGELGEMGTKFAGAARTYRAADAGGVDAAAELDRRLGNP